MYAQEHITAAVFEVFGLLSEAIQILQIAISSTVQPNLFSNSYPSKIEFSLHSEFDFFFLLTVKITIFLMS